MFASQLSGHCDLIANRLWRRHQQNVKRASQTRGWCDFSVIYGLVVSCKNKIMYVRLWRTIYALTRVLFWCLFPSLLRNKHQNNPLVTAWTGRHASTYIILYLYRISKSEPCATSLGLGWNNVNYLYGFVFVNMSKCTWERNLETTMPTKYRNISSVNT